METRRAAILGSLFPALKANQLNNLAATQGTLAVTNAAMPAAGLSGEDLTNLWLQRVGATGNIMGKIGDVAAAGGLSQAALWNQGLGSAFGAVSKAGIPSSIANAIAAYPAAGRVVG